VRSDDERHRSLDLRNLVLADFQCQEIQYFISLHTVIRLLFMMILWCDKIKMNLKGAGRQTS
jgi:hypothetical protein